MKVTWSIKFEIVGDVQSGEYQKYNLLNIQSPGYPSLGESQTDSMLRNGYVYSEGGSSKFGNVLNLYILGNEKGVSKLDEFRVCVYKWIRDYKLEKILADENES